jgi:hypothetical protein
MSSRQQESRLIRDGGCLEPDRLLALIESNVEDERSAECLEHIHSCAECSGNFKDLLATWALAEQTRSLESAAKQAGEAIVFANGSLPKTRNAVPRLSLLTSLRTRFNPPRFALGTISVALLIALIGGSMLQLSRVRQLESRNRELAGNLSSVLDNSKHDKVALTKAEQHIALSSKQAYNLDLEHRQKERDLAKHLAQSQRTAEMRGQSEKRLERQIAELRSSGRVQLNSSTRQMLQRLSDAGDLLNRGITMGGPEADTSGFVLVSPVGTISPRRQVAFAWWAIPGTNSYTVQVRTPDGTRVSNSPPLTTTTWSAVIPFSSQAVPFYIWRVETDNGKHSEGARFVVLDTNRFDLVSQTKRRPR